MKRVIAFLMRAVIALAMLLLTAFVVLGLLPAPADAVLPDAQIVVGAQKRANAAAGVSAEFATIVEPADNASSPQKAELGRLLFFDPALSKNGDRSCAHCHQPDLGFSDGAALGTGSDGKTLARNVPSLYEVAYKSSLFADGRADSLEAQAVVPLTAPNEMGASPEHIETTLSGIDAYRELFGKAFPGDAKPISMQNVTRALAAYERTLLAHDAPFDRFVAGDATALTASQQRGFGLFRSGATGCYKCHAAPTFTSGKFEAIGIPGDDGGRAGITKVDADRGKFMTPSLRNVALSAPYMHNGSLASLSDVLDYYASGGGDAHAKNPAVSRFVRPVSLSAQEKEDMINFLFALTDAKAATIPERVPSGKPVVARATNPAAAAIEAANVGRATLAKRAPQTLRVAAGSAIQAVVDQAIPGDTIEIAHGVYNEQVVINMSDLTVRGVPNASGALPVLDGEMKFTDGINATGDNLLFETLAFKNYKGNGIIVEGATNVIFRDLYVENTSLYGVYPVKSTGVLIERVTATKIRDAGIYAGQCRDVVMRNNEVYSNVIGIEIENSINAELYDNHAHHNSTGIFVDLLPQLPSKVSRKTVVRDNRIEHNNGANFSLAGEIGELVPEGTGILVLGGDDVEIRNNRIVDHRTVGIAIFSTAVAFDKDKLDVQPNPERVHTQGNTFAENGYRPHEKLTSLGLDKGADIVWDGSNWDNRFDDPAATKFPPVLPSSRWPAHARRAYWQVLNFAIKNVL